MPNYMHAIQQLMQRTQGNARQIAELAKRIMRATDG